MTRRESNKKSTEYAILSSAGNSCAFLKVSA